MSGMTWSIINTKKHQHIFTTQDSAGYIWTNEHYLHINRSCTCSLYTRVAMEPEYSLIHIHQITLLLQLTACSSH